MLSLYVHVPFCVKKCPYCGFYSTPYTPGLADDFISGLHPEAARCKGSFDNRLFHTLYIGGGTPTALSIDQFERVVTIIDEHFRFSDDHEFTVEANPNTITNHNLAHMFEQGVNRLSIGVQSFSDDVLKTLGRLHTAEQASAAVIQARKAGFRNIGIDLIYGIPGQTVSRWTETLDKALDMNLEHLSAYGLSLDEGSAFFREAEAGRLAPPDEELTAEMYELTVKKLTRAGYGHYEVSNFCLPGFECRHNMNYWERGEYLGLGPGAWSFFSGRRYGNVSDIHEYRARQRSGLSTIEEEETPGREQAAAETLMLGLRTAGGVELQRYEREYGIETLERLARNAARFVDAGLLGLAGGRLRLSARGMLFSNEVLSALFR